MTLEELQFLKSWAKDIDHYGYGEESEKCAQLLRKAINEAERLQSFRKALEILIPFVKEVQSWYGHNYQVANFHMNDDLEPLDNFIEEVLPDGLDEALKVLDAED